MIIYENNLGDFIYQCANEKISTHIKKGFILSGINLSGNSEIESWDNSLPIIANILDDKSIAKDINVALEYKLDVTKNRIDFLIYGKNESNSDSLVIVELKQWSNVKDSNKPNFIYAFGGGGAKDYLHPSYQSYRYGSILQGFNQFVQDNKVLVETCSFLHNLDNIYDNFINNTNKYPFVEKSPVFLQDDAEKLRSFVKKYVKKSYRVLLYDIENSKIRPSKDFSLMMYNALKGQQIFTLDDAQASSVSTIISETNLALESKKRKTIIIKGGPGTGKSIVAINAMGQLLHPSNDVKSRNVCYCTTNFTPRTLFSELLIDNDYTRSAIKELFKPLATFAWSREFDYDCVLYDEAHRAYTWKFGQGIKRDVDMIDKAFYASRVNVFFIDEDQMVTKDDYLTVERIKKYARKYSSEIIETDDLNLTSQFRCLGGEKYVSFISSLLGYDNNIIKYRAKNYDFKVFDSPSLMWKEIQSKQEEYPYSRLLAGYTHDWISQYDDTVFDFVLENGDFKMKWNKKVPFSYINDPTQFDRIGCIHTIQGVDMSYAGVIIGKDIIFRNGEILFRQDQNADTDKASGIKNASYDLAKKMIRNTYKVLLTRAIYGTYVYCEDKALNDYVKSFVE